jgi:hypothetical protein
MTAPPPPTPNVISYESVYVRVDFVGPTGSPPIVYDIVRGYTTNASDPNNSLSSTVPESGDVRSAIVGIGQSDVTNYLWVRSTQGALVQNSAVPAIVIISQPVAAGIPSLYGKIDDTITVRFEAVPFNGTQAQTFSIRFGLDPDPNYIGNTTIPADLVAGNTWQVGPFTVPQGVDVYIFSQVVTEGTDNYDRPRAPLFSQALVYNGTPTPGNLPPSGPTSIPTLLVASNSALSVRFNIIGVTGTAPLLPTCSYALSPAGPFDLATQLSTTDNITFTATAVGLVSDIDYYFQTTLSNGILPNQDSVVAGPFRTTSIPVTNTPFAVNVEAREITMRFNVPLGTVLSTTAASLLWGALPNVNLQPNSVVATYLGIISSQPTWEATVYGLTPGRSYFFQGLYAPLGVSSVIQQQTELGNLFDFGYMPPRPWATPNPVIVSGVSQPWRQT